MTIQDAKSNIDEDLTQLSAFLSGYSAMEKTAMDDDFCSSSTLVNSFGKIETQIQFGKVSGELVGLERLFQAFQPLDEELNRLLADTAPHYNIFSVLNVRHYETKLHTPFLCHLLNPNASHAQGRLFFDSFFSKCLGFQDIDKIKSIQVFEEYPCTYGRIDILVNYRVNKTDKALVIENKIYHHDEEGQLKRYYEYLTKERKIGEGDYHLVYLKPNVCEPTTTSLPADLLVQLQQKGSISCLGYHQNVESWLSAILSKIKAPNIQHVINQYISIIKTL